MKDLQKKADFGINFKQPYAEMVTDNESNTRTRECSTSFKPDIPYIVTKVIIYGICIVSIIIINYLF